jgi:phospholipid/cholesterol/gamma-HCH transport system ATP-binding protein
VGPPSSRAASQEIHVDVRDVTFARGRRSVFRGLSCRFPRRSISVILGGSGAGKSTLLRMIGCLTRPQSGDIWVDGEVELTCMPERQARRFRRNIGMMFQGGALLDSMSILDNVALPLREHTKKGEPEIRDEVHAVFGSVGLSDVDALLPGELSGGMMKRAALARALILHPAILMCDEPFSGLDPKTVRMVEKLLMDVNRRLGVTMLITSHHIESTFRMADHVVLILDGRAIEGPPAFFLESTDSAIREFLAGEAPAPAAPPVRVAAGDGAV